MDVQRFVEWCSVASTAERTAVAENVAAGFAEGGSSGRQSAGMSFALAHLAVDPSPKVRTAIALGLADTSAIPRNVLLALCHDNDAIACIVIARSPALDDYDLIDLAEQASPAVQGAIATRGIVSLKVSAALARVADASVCEALLANPNAAFAARTYHGLSERFSTLAPIRDALLARGDLPATIRQRVVVSTGSALARMPLFLNLVGAGRAEATVSRACERATIELAADAASAEAADLVDHLRESGQLTSAFLARLVCGGHVDLFATALSALSGQEEDRVRAALASGRLFAVRKVMEKAKLPSGAQAIFAAAIDIWREIDGGRSALCEADVPQAIIRRLAPGSSFRRGADDGEVESIVRFLHAMASEGELTEARGPERRLAA